MEKEREKVTVYAKTADYEGIQNALREVLIEANRNGIIEGNVLNITIPDIEIIYPKTGEKFPETTDFTIIVPDNEKVTFPIRLTEASS